MFDFKVTPKNLLLGVLQTGDCQPLPIKALVEIGALFGFSDNVIRVTIARLLSSGLLEKDSDGYYQLAIKESFLSRLVGRWHLGEERCVSWQGDWIACLLTSKVTAAEEKTLRKKFDYLGFKKAHPMMWVRPNNLVLSLRDIDEYLLSLGVVQAYQLFVISEVSAEVERAWPELYPVKPLMREYQKRLKVLQKSRKTLSKLSLDKAAVESFLVGSEVVNLLAVDPLLPSEILDTTNRVLLTEEMREYDLLGQKVWWQKFSEMELGENLSPAHLNFL